MIREHYQPAYAGKDTIAESLAEAIDHSKHLVVDLLYEQYEALIGELKAFNLREHRVEVLPNGKFTSEDNHNGFKKIADKVLVPDRHPMEIEAAAY